MHITQQKARFWNLNIHAMLVMYFKLGFQIR